VFGELKFVSANINITSYFQRNLFKNIQRLFCIFESLKKQPNMNPIISYVQIHKDRFVSELIELLKIPSVSADVFWGKYSYCGFVQKRIKSKTILMGFGLDFDAIHSPNECFGFLII
jgi:hypothetical protein